MKMWQKFAFQMEFSQFNKILMLINSEVKSEDWYRSFMTCQTTHWFFEGLKLSQQLDFVEKILKAYELSYGVTNDPKDEFS